MIKINNKQDCCGCKACVQKCPKHCITMQKDEEGFYYPKVDETTCIECHLCEKVCPVINQNDPTYPISIYAAKNNSIKELEISSSGGIFSLIATHVIKQGGVVFGTAFNSEWEVCHVYVDKVGDLHKLKGSKYVQSDIESTFYETKEFLEEGRIVLFTGTPCQIAGLKKYLSKDYENLICVDIICHGSPSPGIWKDYIKEIQEQKKIIISKITFRDKTNGWKNFGFSVCGKSYSSNNDLFMLEPVTTNLYMRGFLHNLYLRPSCYKCPARQGKSGSDLMIGDFWGVQRRYPDFYDPMGVSLVLAYSEKGMNLFEKLESTSINVTYDDALDCNINVEKDELMPSNRDKFFNSYKKRGIQVIDKYCNQLEPSYVTKVIKKLQYKFKHLLNK